MIRWSAWGATVIGLLSSLPGIAWAQFMEPVDPADLGTSSEGVAAHPAPDERLPLVIDLYDFSPSLPKPQDAVTWVLFDLRCDDDLHLRETTLYADGMVRVRGLKAAPIALGKLSPHQLEHFERRLVEQSAFAGDPDASRIDSQGLRGDWVERCKLRVKVPERRPVEYRFGEFDTKPPWVEALSLLADELAAFTEPIRDSRVPQGYTPRPGDLLERRDGRLYRVAGLTTDGAGLMVDSTTEPLREFFPVAEIDKYFVAVIPESLDRDRP
jgi:hypothetical protein